MPDIRIRREHTLGLAKARKIPMYAPAGLNQALVSLGEMPADLAPRMNKGGESMDVAIEMANLLREVGA